MLLFQNNQFPPWCKNQGWVGGAPVLVQTDSVGSHSCFHMHTGVGASLYQKPHSNVKVSGPISPGIREKEKEKVILDALT